MSDQSCEHADLPSVAKSKPDVSEFEEKRTDGILTALDKADKASLWVHDPDVDEVFELLERPTEVGRNRYAAPLGKHGDFSHLIAFSDADENYYQCMFRP